VDVLEQLHDSLVDQALEASDDAHAPSMAALPTLDRLANAISEVSVIGEAEQLEKEGREASSTDHDRAGLGVSPAGPLLSLIAEKSDYRRAAKEREVLLRGVARHHVHFGNVGTTLRKLVPTLPGGRLWLLLDEWSHVPLHLQPFLADLLRHCVLPVRGLTVKIAAIEHRSLFKIARDGASYIGFEVGADVAADIDLDEFMVFSSDNDMAVQFFAHLFYRHLAAQDGGATYQAADAFVAGAFASESAFRELVRAGEGVPRDAINIVGKAALQAGDRRISINHIREAARRWYLQDKEGTVKSRADGLALLHWIMDQVIGHRKARGFLIRQGTEGNLIDWLYDQRVLHLVKRGIAAKDHAGVRYDAYVLDYGCYVDLLATRDAAPRGLLPTDTDVYLDVPPDTLEDAMRGAILNLSAFEAQQTGSPDAPPAVAITVRGTNIETIVPSDDVTDLTAQLEQHGWYLLTEVAGHVAAIPVGHRALSIGSSTSSHIRIKDGDLLAKHASLSRADPELTLSNHQLSPVYVNGRRSRSANLADRDSVRMGELNFVVVCRT
jgi:hypothetical protein